MIERLRLTPISHIVRYLRDVGRSYWPQSAEALATFGQTSTPSDLVSPEALGRAWVSVDLPPWAADLGISGRLLVDKAAIAPGEGPDFERCDWWLAAFSHASGIAELHWERAHGPAHSYRFRQSSLDDAAFDRAWANRILLLIRRISARNLDRSESEVFGTRPRSTIEMTHDVDALDKTAAIRLKQSLFDLFISLRLATRREWRQAVACVLKSARFAVTTSSYDWLLETADIAEQAGLRSIFHVYARIDRGPRHPRQWLFDPSYGIDDGPLTAFFQVAAERGWEIGLHPSFDSWDNAERIAAERALLSSGLGQPIQRCRQHWLRFSWRDTWRAQTEAGLGIDSTLGFNDRPGFRTGTALRYKPWNFYRQRPHEIDVVPLVLMDSHLYSYRPTNQEGRLAVMRGLHDEVEAVGGHAAVLWHPHTLASDYGWRAGYTDLLGILKTAEARS